MSNITSRLSQKPQVPGSWSHDKFQDTSSPSDSPYLVQLSNLHYNVNEQELIDLFGGPTNVLKCNIQYDISGRSEGLAKLVFVNKKVAETYQDRYKGQRLDGKELVIQLVKEYKIYNKKSNNGGFQKSFHNKSLDDRLGSKKKDLDSRLGKTLDDRLGPKRGTLDDRLGPRLEDRLGSKKVGKKQKKQKAKNLGEKAVEREIQSYDDQVPEGEMAE